MVQVIFMCDWKSIERCGNFRNVKHILASKLQWENFQDLLLNSPYKWKRVILSEILWNKFFDWPLANQLSFEILRTCRKLFFTYCEHAGNYFFSDILNLQEIIWEPWKQADLVLCLRGWLFPHLVKVVAEWLKIHQN